MPPNLEASTAPSPSSTRPAKNETRVTIKGKCPDDKIITNTSTSENGKMAEGDLQLVDKFKSDLDKIRNLVTCPICDQLLYEPYTLACGHTYCYSCLCSWCPPNKKKKTCPECRTAVTQIPAPAFLVKQMVETLINRNELMASDESIEQHLANRAEEIKLVEKDKNSPEGLFKGTFKERGGELWRDEEDGVLRCPSCGHEYEGGPICLSCGTEVDEDDDEMYAFSDMDDGNLSELDVEAIEGMEAELRADVRHHHHHHYYDIPHFGRVSQDFIHHLQHHHPFHHANIDDDQDEDDDEDEDSDMSDNQDDSDEEDAGSLNNFVVQDDDEEPISSRRANRRIITISDDDEDDESDDEGGAITNRRRQRHSWNGNRNHSDTPSVTITITEDENGSSTNGSEFGDDDAHEARMVLRASPGWSPLDEGDDDAEGLVQYDGYPATEDERATDESDTDTIGNMPSDREEDDRSRSSMSQTPRYQTPDYHDARYPASVSDTPNSYASENEYPYDYEDQFANTDHDGDTEMSVSPGESRSSRGVSEESHEQSNTSFRAQDLGAANDITEVDDDSDGSIVARPRRRRPRHNPLVQQYDPRISMLFAEHQLSMRDTRDSAAGLDGWDEMGRIESASRTRRRPPTHYHNTAPSRGTDSLHQLIAPRGVDMARSSRGIVPLGRPSSSSSRTHRPQRQHPGR